mmetsp:Transcript_87413/g.168246  ORF Transcript_87413/g.168246 Transcript_87413/m.168246 type:complete len:616 (-) Transcript_87413:4-1851(-)
MSPLAADGIVRQTLGGEAERLGKQLDVDTLKYLEEAKSCRALQIPAGQDQLTAMEYVAYLGIKLDLEPELAWLAREMLAAPMPPNAELKVSKAGVVYFHDTVNDYYTIEHPLTQRYLKVLERQRVDLLCLGTKPSVNGLLFKQPDMLFQRQFRNLQIPCQSCGVMQSTVKCNQCLMSFCGSCADALHKTSLGPRSNHTFLQTACGSLCSSCTMKKPQVYCANCEDYFCFKCFEDMHGKGNRQQHKSMLVNVSDGDIIEPQKRCEECEDNPAAFACDYCLDNFCVKCFWQCHVNGHRRTHTATKVNVVPQCNQCQNIRATVFCEQCQELMCTECFTKVHAKGNRMLHLFMDAMDLLVLLERLDPTFQEHMRRARPRVLWAVTQLQGWVKLIDTRRWFKKRKDVVIMIQCRWRGVLQRRKLLGMLHMHKWRRRQVNSYFLPKTAEERRIVKQKVSSMMAAKEVSQKAATATLRELKETILDTAGADERPEDLYEALGLEPVPSGNTALGNTLANGGAALALTAGGATAGRTGSLALAGGSSSGAQGMAALGDGPSAYRSYEGNSRFAGSATTLTGGPVPALPAPNRGADVSMRDTQRMNGQTLRQLARLDDSSPPRR